MRNAEGALGAAPIQPKEKNMKHPIAALGLLTLASLSTACTRYIHDTFDVDAGSGATLDAQQRVVLVTKQGGPYHNQFLVCAEPSPDAMSAIAGAVALQGGNAQAQGGLSAAMSEAAASIGIPNTDDPAVAGRPLPRLRRLSERGPRPRILPDHPAQL